MSGRNERMWVLDTSGCPIWDFPPGFVLGQRQPAQPMGYRGREEKLWESLPDIRLASLVP